MTPVEKMNINIANQMKAINNEVESILEAEYNYSEQPEEVKDAINEIIMYEMRGLHKFRALKPKDETYMLVSLATGAGVITKREGVDVSKQ